MHGYEGFISYIEQHAGCPVDVHIIGSEEPWELERIETVIETPSAVFIGGTVLGVGRPLINLASVSSIMFCPPDGDGKGRHDIPDPNEEKKTLTSVTSIAVNQ